MWSRRVYGLAVRGKPLFLSLSLHAGARPRVVLMTNCKGLVGFLVSLIVFFVGCADFRSDLEARGW